MIDLTPLDVRKKKGDFRKGLRGYETPEVDAFLDLVAERMEELVRENTELRDRTASLDESIGAYRSREQAMNEALVSAQELRDDIRKQTQREADLMIREAKAEGVRLLEEAKRAVERQRAQIEKYRAQRDRFLRMYRGFLEAQMDELSREEERIVRARSGELDEPEEEAVG